MIYGRELLTQDQVLRVDVCVIGSGAAGAAAAWSAARAGKKVAVLEAGQFLTPKDFTQREEQMFPKLFYGAGGRRTQDRNIRVLHGHGVGGSTLHNINLCKRIPDEVINEWDLPTLNASRLAPYLAQVEELLGVVPILESQINASNRLFRKGVEKLGYRGGILHHNRQGCVGSGFCELGCAYDAKKNALRVLIPEAVKHGADVYSDTRVARLDLDGRKILRAHAFVGDLDGSSPQALLTFEASVFICAAGAIETPALLQRSKLQDPHQLIGSRLHLHPGVVAAGVFEEKVESWKGVPQSYECTEFLKFKGEDREDRRVWMIAGAAHPVGSATLLPGMGAEHRGLMSQYPHYAPLSAMVHDRTRGRVEASGSNGVKIDYVLEPRDRSQLALGLKEASRILFAGGAREVLLPFRKAVRLKSVSELDSLEIQVNDLDIDVVSVHPMSSVWMGRSSSDSCVDETGRYHHLDNLYVCDTSVYPTSLGTPPQVTTYAMGLYVAERVLSHV